MGVLIRIILRYLAAFLVAKGVFSPDIGDLFAYDPDILLAVQVAAGVVSAAVAETYYYLARRFGWPK